jgi:hypothetical protein
LRAASPPHNARNVAIGCPLVAQNENSQPWSVPAARYSQQGAFDDPIQSYSQKADPTSANLKKPAVDGLASKNSHLSDFSLNVATVCPLATRNVNLQPWSVPAARLSQRGAFDDQSYTKKADPTSANLKKPAVDGLASKNSRFSGFSLARECNGTHPSTHNYQLDSSLEHPKENNRTTHLKWSENTVFDTETIKMAMHTGRIKWSEELASEINKDVLYSLKVCEAVPDFTLAWLTEVAIRHCCESSPSEAEQRRNESPSAAHGRATGNASHEHGRSDWDSDSSRLVARNTTTHVGEVTAEPAISRTINAPANAIEPGLAQRNAMLESECCQLRAALAAAEKKLDGTLHDLENERNRRQQAEDAQFIAMRREQEARYCDNLRSTYFNQLVETRRELAAAKQKSKRRGKELLNLRRELESMRLAQESMPATSVSNPAEGEFSAFPAAGNAQSAHSNPDPTEGESSAFPATLECTIVTTMALPHDDSAGLVAGGKLLEEVNKWNSPNVDMAPLQPASFNDSPSAALGGPGDTDESFDPLHPHVSTFQAEDQMDEDTSVGTSTHETAAEADILVDAPLRCPLDIAGIVVVPILRPHSNTRYEGATPYGKGWKAHIRLPGRRAHERIATYRLRTHAIHAFRVADIILLLEPTITLERLRVHATKEVLKVFPKAEQLDYRRRP